MKRKYVVLLLLALGVGGTITWQALRPPTPTRVVTARAETVGTLRHLVTATGEIRAKEFVDIQAEVAGVITELSVREGDTVQKGAVLLRLEDLQLRAEADAARAQVGAAEADAKNADVAVATAEANLAAERTALAGVKLEAEQARVTRDRSAASFARKRDLFQSALIGSEEFEAAEAEARLAQQRLEWNEARIEQAGANLQAVATRVEAAKAQREAAGRRVEAAEAQLARAVDLVGKTELRAPLSGLITKLNVEKGERAVPGIQSNPIATLMTIADMSVIEAEIQVDEADIVHVTVDAPAEVEVDAIRDVKFAGVVTEIGHSPIQTSGSGNGSSQNQEGKDFKVVVRLQSPAAQLRPGFTATAEIVTAVRRSVLVVPLQALTAREVEFDGEGHYVAPPEPDGRTEAPLSAEQRQRRKEVEGVFVLQDGRARFRPIDTGITGEMDIEVTRGLTAGEVVVSGPYQVLRTLKEWDRITVDEERQRDLDARARRKR
ncbi:MAG: efflux RND transporter periplasmic adaptor subunit [Planctomycetes bacterium]|nr:efflux RND transporter periplasmic adaptor subunit [Planctomycetota bacterium]